MDTLFEALGAYEALRESGFGGFMEKDSSAAKERRLLQLRSAPPSFAPVSFVSPSSPL
jgi:hypothetical protein